MTFLFKLLDNVPPPPQHLIDAVDRNKRPNASEIGFYHARTLRNWNERDISAAVNTRQSYPEFEAWVKENVTKHIVDAGVNYVNVDHTDIALSTGAHTDGVREYTLMWHLDAGGDNATTHFWQEKGHQLRRPPKTQGEDLTKLDLVGTAPSPLNKWILIDTQVLHSVEDLYRTRISLQISLLNRIALGTVVGITDVGFLDE
jgi:hypothetical protein